MISMHGQATSRLCDSDLNHNIIDPGGRDMTEPHYETILWERRGRILTLTMNRPDQLNAVNAKLHEELATVFREAERDPDSDIIVLTGAGKAFCAGGDVRWMQDAIDNPISFEKTCVEAKQIIYAMLDCEKPIIGRINGHAMGLGCTLALFCDVTFMAANARIGDPHVLMGMVAGDGGAVIWPALVGLARAKEFLMTGDPLTADDAGRIGLVNHVVPLADLDSRVYGFAERLAGGALQSIRWSKVSLNIHLKQVAHAVMDTSIAYEALTNRSADHQEAVNAFRERRKPVFTGR